jgi:hypothetical protein
MKFKRIKDKLTQNQKPIASVRMVVLVVILILCIGGCMEHTPSKTIFLTADAPSHIDLPIRLKEDSHGEFETLVNRWNLSGLFPNDYPLTVAQRDAILYYVQQFDQATQQYILLLLQGIATNAITLQEGVNDHKAGVYLMFTQIYLYDMNQDGTMECILKTGSSEADYQYTIFTMVQDELICCGELSGSHATLYTHGSGALVRYAGQMGVYTVDISSLTGTALHTETIADGVVDNGEDYPTLEQLEYGEYDQVISCSDIPPLYLAAAG